MPYKKVVAFGDSFTRGDELSDCPDYHKSELAGRYSTNTWPALIAKNIDTEYDCKALGGKGNRWISFQLFKNLSKLQDCLVIINWSWFERFDYFAINKKIWKTVHPQHDNHLSHFFFKHIDSEVWNTHQNLQQIHSTICLLQQNNIDFIMTCIDPMLYYDRKKNEVFHNQILHYIINFWGYNFLEWAKHKGFSIGPGGHPLEKAHVEAANYINMVTTEGRKNGH